MLSAFEFVCVYSSCWWLQRGVWWLDTTISPRAINGIDGISYEWYWIPKSYLQLTYIYKIARASSSGMNRFCNSRIQTFCKHDHGIKHNIGCFFKLPWIQRMNHVWNIHFVVVEMCMQNLLLGFQSKMLFIMIRFCGFRVPYTRIWLKNI